VKTKIIAEVASCHNGDIEIGKGMVKAAAQAGVDIVKFQSWQAKNVPLEDPDRKRYERLELSDGAHEILMKTCEEHGVEFMTTCFDIDRIAFLRDLGLEKIKVASFDLKSYDLLEALGKNFSEVIVSTGQSHPEEVEKASQVLKSTGTGFTFLHCVSMYPCPYEKANLGRMEWLRKFAPAVGYSDHTADAEAAKLAIGMGAAYVEKHFTTDKDMEQEGHTASAKEGTKPTTTHQMASEPPVFAEICEFNKNAALIYGTGRIDMMDEEMFHREKYTGRLSGISK
jgi:sialic acid synthase SpsE